MENGKKYDGPLCVKKGGRYFLPDNVEGAYATITYALADLNTYGVSGHTRFLLMDSSYPNETFPLTVHVTAVNTPNASRTVTIKPNTGTTVVLSGEVNGGPVLKILNTNYVTIDGSNTAGGSSRNMIIHNTSPSGSSRPQVVWFGSWGSTPISCDTLKNCGVYGYSPYVTAEAVMVCDGSTAETPGYFTNIGIINNKILNSYYGIYVSGVGLALNGQGTCIRGNNLAPAGTGDSVGHCGIIMLGVDGGSIALNDIGGLVTVGVGQNVYGIYIGELTKNTIVEKNTIHDLSSHSDWPGYSFGGIGIAIATGVANCSNTIANNMIHNIHGDGYNTIAGAKSGPVGIYAFAAWPLAVQSGLNISFNSIYLSGNSLNLPGAYSVGIALDDTSSANINDNIVVNNLGLLGSWSGGNCRANISRTAYILQP
jgi:hypothetical protein